MGSNNYTPQAIEASLQKLNEEIHIKTQMLAIEKSELEKYENLSKCKSWSKNAKFEKKMKKLKNDFSVHQGQLKKTLHKKENLELRKKNSQKYNNNASIKDIITCKEKTTSEQTSPFYPSDNVLYVHRGIIKCVRNKHEIECVNGIFTALDGKKVSINVNYCKSCELLFISENEYCKYLKKYKAIIANVKPFPDDEIEQDVRLAPSSTLRLCGYSVSEEDGLSALERKQLLEKIISEGIMTKSAVIRMLEWFIHMNGQKSSNAVAKKKWEQDLEFISKFNIENQKNYRISDIKSYVEYRKST